MKYDVVNYDPPAPLVKVTILRPISRSSESGKGKIDTGADISVIPFNWVERLALVPAGSIFARGYDGRGEEVDTYFVGMEFAGLKFNLTKVMAANRKDVLIGRDILNKLSTELDGKRLNFEIHDP